MSTSWIECSSSVPAPGRGRVGAPRRVVLPLDRDVLVVAEHDRHQPARRRVVDQVAHQRGTRASGAGSSPTWFVTPASLTTSASGVRAGERRSPAASRRTRRARAPRPASTSARVLRGPGAHVHRVAPVEHLLHAACTRGAPLRRGERRCPRGVGVVHAGALDVRAAARSIFEWNVAISPAPRNPMRIDGHGTRAASSRPARRQRSRRGGPRRTAIRQCRGFTVVVGDDDRGDPVSRSTRRRSTRSRSCSSASSPVSGSSSSSSRGAGASDLAERDALGLATGQRGHRAPLETGAARRGRATRPPVRFARASRHPPSATRTRRSPARRGAGTAGCPGTRHRSRRRCGGQRVTSSPSHTTVPGCGHSSPAITRSSVDLPLPLGPRSATTSPEATVERHSVEHRSVADRSAPLTTARRAGIRTSTLARRAAGRRPGSARG